jgi:hypothetical protein
MRNQIRSQLSGLAFSTLALTCFVSQSLAAQPTPTPTAAPTATAPATGDTTNAERVNTEAIKEKYWARGDESEIGVVQNRLYSKANKVIAWAAG